MSTPIANNPLAKHFRQPSIYLKLPSLGKFYPQDAIELSATGEIAIFPMTIKDEVLLKTPDALMNGEGMAAMLSSCCPSIKDPWAIPLTDLDPILIAIRLATYGAGMDVNSDCTACNAANEHTIDLRAVLDNIAPMKKYDELNVIDGLTFKFKPQTYKDLNTSQILTFEQEKLISAITNSELTPEDKKQRFTESFEKITELNIGTVVNCIESITTEDGTIVKDAVLIKDFLANTTTKIYEAIRELINQTVGANVMEPVEVECAECHEKYKVKVEFNQSRFFS